jgi:hypothetical protein
VNFVVCASSVYTLFIAFSILWKILFFSGLAYSKDVRATIIGVAAFEIGWLGALYLLLKILDGGCMPV